MKNLKNILPILVFLLTVVLAGVSVLTSNELAKRKQVTPEKSYAAVGICPGGGCSCSGREGLHECDTPGGKMCCSAVDDPDPSGRTTHQCDSASKRCVTVQCELSGCNQTCSSDSDCGFAPVCTPTTATCGSCSGSCGSGTQTCSNGCSTYSQACSIPCSPTPTNTSTPTVTPTKTPTPTVTPTGTLTPTLTPTNTPTPTITPTNTPTPTPQPNAYRHNICVDRSCVQRDCVPSDQPCTNQCSGEVDCNSHRVCSNDKCVVVVGSGSDQCQVDADCNKHRACVSGNKCQLVDGKGPDSCQVDADCATVVAPATPKAATVEPTVLTVVGGIGMFILGAILFAL